MPEVLFTVQLPDGVKKTCYSPSTVIRDHFHTGEEMLLTEFLQRSRVALVAASERVRAKYGFACSSALDQLAGIEEWGGIYPGEGIVRIIRI